LVKVPVSLSMDENYIKTIETLSKQKGLSKSAVVERLCSIGLKYDSDLTPEQRYHFGRCVFIDRCSDILRLHSIVVHEGGISDKFMLIVALSTSICTKKSRESRNAIYNLSVFELLNDLKGFDKDIFNDCIAHLNKNRKLSDEYFELYPR
jgi:hypothetical protein